MKEDVNMLQIGDTLISLDLFEKRFICDLPACHGSCCVEGDSGAPLTQEEKQIIEDLLPDIWDDLSPEAQKLIKKQGVSYVDGDGDLVTSIIKGKECVFTYFDENGTCKCAIEKAYNEGKSDFKKPVSCHLYPVRVKKYPTFQAVNYDKWEICKPALDLGEKLGVPIYKFVKDALIRKFGEDWYNELNIAAVELAKQK
ncbi:DUF3109 family protein [Saccharicrinis sp. FJH2]|uniref:DUF3109 family protein n=1 Tax=Saccharicrinis sp. FJH65 TaxID=3344659 RepID=UPI0035F26786